MAHTASEGAEVYRAPMRARDRDLPAGAGGEHGIARRLVGIGDALPRAPADADEAAELAAAIHGAKAGRMVDRFASLPDGSFVWTRVADGSYRLGRIAGAWRYDESPAAIAVGIHHVRPARWLDRPFQADEAPAAVVATFARGGRNLQRIRDPAAEELTARLWELGAGSAGRAVS